MPLVKTVAQSNESGSNTIKCDFERYGRKGQFRSGVYLQLAWIEDGSPAEPWVDLDVWCGASQLDPDCRNSCFSYPRQGQRLLYVSWVASGPDEWDPRPVVERTAETLAASFEERTAACPAGFEPPAPSVITLVLTGGLDEEPPPVGATIFIPQDDQHQLVIGGPDGAVIREEFIGEQATVTAFGSRVTDAGGNWSVLVTVDVTATTGAVPPESPTRSPAPSPPPSHQPAPAPAPATSGPSATTVEATSSPSPTREAEWPPIVATVAPGAAASPGRLAPPELIGVPAGIAAIVANLPPAGAGAVRNISDHIAVLGERLEEAESGRVTVPPGDIGSLRELLPGLVQEVWLTDGAVVVSATDPAIGSILVTPVIGDDGLVSVQLSRYQIATLHPVVRALVAALNGYVAERGGRFTSVTVSPEGLAVSAERAREE